MEQITYKKDGVLISGKFISLSEITSKCNAEKTKEGRMLLLRMEWRGWRGFNKGVLEEIVLSEAAIKTIKKHILGKTIYFGEIAGKHSDIYNSLDDNDIEVISDTDKINEFLLSNPSGHSYNHSFLHTFLDYASSGGYDDISEEEAKEFSECLN